MFLFKNLIQFTVVAHKKKKKENENDHFKNYSKLEFYYKTLIFV